MQFASPVAPTRSRGNFVLLRADTLRLLLPQEDVGDVEYLTTRPRASSEPGLFELDDPDRPEPRVVSALSPQMGLATTFPPARFLLTSFAAQADLALCWDEVKVLIDIEIETHEVPAVLLHEGAPLRSFVEFDDGPAFHCSGERLLAHAFMQRS